MPKSLLLLEPKDDLLHESLGLQRAQKRAEEGSLENRKAVSLVEVVLQEVCGPWELASLEQRPFSSFLKVAEQLVSH